MSALLVAKHIFLIDFLLVDEIYYKVNLLVTDVTTYVRSKTVLTPKYNSLSQE